MRSSQRQAKLYRSKEVCHLFYTNSCFLCDRLHLRTESWPDNKKCIPTSHVNQDESPCRHKKQAETQKRKAIDSLPHCKEAEPYYRLLRHALTAFEGRPKVFVCWRVMAVHIQCKNEKLIGVFHCSEWFSCESSDHCSKCRKNRIPPPPFHRHPYAFICPSFLTLFGRRHGCNNLRL